MLYLDIINGLAVIAACALKKISPKHPCQLTDIFSENFSPYSILNFNKSLWYSLTIKRNCEHIIGNYSVYVNKNFVSVLCAHATFHMAWEQLSVLKILSHLQRCIFYIMLALKLIMRIDYVSKLFEHWTYSLI